MPSIKGFSTALFGNLVDKYQDMFTFVRDGLKKANMKIAFRTYMSIVFFVSLIIFFSSLIGTIIILYFIKISLLLKIMCAVFIPALVTIISFLIMVFYPLQKMSARKKDIESNLPFVLTHMGAVAESGVPPYVIFKLISQFEEYGEISKEMGKIVRNIETFGTDPLTAVKEVANKTPSDAFKQMLLGFVSTTESGGNIRLYLKNAGEQALFNWRIKRERFLQQLSAYAEFYTGILIAAPLFIIALFSVMNMIQPTLGRYGILYLMKVSIYLIVPIMNIVFLLFLRGVEVEI